MKVDRPPRDPKKLLIEIDARMKVRDIREWDRLRRQVDIQWWESGLFALLFISGVGLFVTLWRIIPAENSLLYQFIFGWCVVFFLALFASLEFLLLKFRALRRLNETLAQRLEEHDRSLRAIRQYLEAVEDAERENEKAGQ